MPRRSSLLFAFIVLVFAPQMSIGQVDPNRLKDAEERVERSLRWTALREKGAVIYQKSVQDELKLSDNQIVKLRQIFGKVSPNELKFNQQFRSAIPEEAAALNKKMSDYFEDVDATISNILNADQSQRLQQLHLQSVGASAMARPAQAKALDLSSQQMSHLLRLNVDLGRLGTRPRPEAEEIQKNEETRKKINEQLLGVLNEEQRAKWKKMLGEPFEFRPDEVRKSRMAMLVGDHPAGPASPSANQSFVLFMKMNLLSKMAVRTELKLTDDQAAILDEARSEFQTLNDEGNKIGLGQANRREERARISAAQEKSCRRAITDNFTTDQLERLHELYLQDQGPSVLDQPDIVKTVGLEDWQLTEVRSIKRRFLVDASAASRSPSPADDRQKLAKAFNETEGPRRDAKLLELLTKEQRSKWDQLLGKPLPTEQLKGSQVQP